MIDYRDYQPQYTSRNRENIEWSITYHFNARNGTYPRVLLIGDSIVNGYHPKVREKLADKADISFWASAKCVTDKDYFRELDFLLDTIKYDYICFNNGCHSHNSDRTEWEAAYRAVLLFIKAKCDGVPISVVLTTPQREDYRCELSHELNVIAERIAVENDLPIIDLYTPMQSIDKQTMMRDSFHFVPEAIEMQAQIIAEHLNAHMILGGGNVQAATETGPDGGLK